MSMETEHGFNERDFTLLAQADDFDFDELTDRLVEALDEAFRILREEIAADRLH